MNELNAVENKVIIALLMGAHTADMITANGNENYKDICVALVSLQVKGLIKYDNNNMANEFGYYLTEKGWNSIE